MASWTDDPRDSIGDLFSLRRTRYLSGVVVCVGDVVRRLRRANTYTLIGERLMVMGVLDGPDDETLVRSDAHGGRLTTERAEDLVLLQRGRKRQVR